MRVFLPSGGKISFTTAIILQYAAISQSIIEKKVPIQPKMNSSHYILVLVYFSVEKFIRIFSDHFTVSQSSGRKHEYAAIFFV